MKSRSPQFLASGGTSAVTWEKLWPWSEEASTTGYHWPFLATMKEAYTVPSGPTAIAGSQALRLELAAPGSESGALKVLPPSVETEKPMPLQPIQSSYT